MMNYRVQDPASGELIREYGTATDSEIAERLDVAAAASRGWAHDVTVEGRSAVIARAAALFDDRKRVLAEIAMREMGKSRQEAESEVQYAARICDYYARRAETLLADTPIALEGAGGTAVIRCEAFGLLLGIMPWNFPYYQVVRFAAPNLCAGNTILLKHAPQCPESAAAIETLLHDAGVPQGVYTNIYANERQVAEIIADPRVAGVSFTGSAAGGRAVAETAGRNLTKVVLELGGSDPFIVLSTNNMDRTVDDAVAARMYNTGQACNAAKRFVVAGQLYGEFVEKFTARLLALEEGIQPLSSQEAATRLESQVDRAVAQGAHYVGTRKRHGSFFPPGLLLDVTRGNEVYEEELFGPVAMVIRAGSEDEAVEIANDSPYGLGSYVYTTDPEQAQRVAENIDAGMVFVNGVRATAANLPFGGVKNSGFGRELGDLGIGEFVNKKLIRTLE